MQSFVRQICSALDYLHNEKQMIHKDIKPQNILLDKSAKTFKLGDLGVSTHLTKTLCTKEASQGTMRYMPPEQLNGKLSLKSDIWSLGCVLLEMCTGKPPFFDIENEITMSMRIVRGENPLYYATKKYREQLGLISKDSGLQDLIQKCLSVNYKLRPTAPEILSHPFMSLF